MFSGSFETFSLRAVAAALLAGVAIKFMDDHVDREVDEICGRHSFALILNGALLPYALLCVALACALDSPLAGSLIIGSYIVGMLPDLDEVFPSGLSARLESVVVGLLGVILLGWRAVLSSAVLMFGIQFLDDIIDYLREGITAGRNYARSFGYIGAGTAALAFMLTGFVLDSGKTMAVMAAFLILTAGERALIARLTRPARLTKLTKLEKRGWTARDS